MNTELEINCKTVTEIFPGSSGIQRIQDAEHAPDYIAPRKWKHETKGRS
jgi:hypothetical protein